MWLTNRSGDAYLEIVKMAVETSQHTTALIGSNLSTRHGHDMCFQLLFIHSISGSEMTARIFGFAKTAFRSLKSETLSFDFVSTHSPSRTRQHWLSKVIGVK